MYTCNNSVCRYRGMYVLCTYMYIYIITLFVDVPPLLLQSECPAVQEEVLPAGARHGLPACPAGLLPDGPGCCGQEGN